MRATGVFESFSKCRTPTAALRYGPCTQFINVSQRALHIYWQFSAMSHAIHKIVSKRRCQSYFISRRSPHHGKSKNRDLRASSQSRFLFCLCAAHCSRNSQFNTLPQYQSLPALQLSCLRSRGFCGGMPASNRSRQSRRHPRCYPE